MTNYVFLLFLRKIKYFPEQNNKITRILEKILFTSFVYFVVKIFLLADIKTHILLPRKHV